jgi:hypothetical protein
MFRRFITRPVSSSNFRAPRGCLSPDGQVYSARNFHMWGQATENGFTVFGIQKCGDINWPVTVMV